MAVGLLMGFIAFVKSLLLAILQVWANEHWPRVTELLSVVWRFLLMSDISHRDGA